MCTRHGPKKVNTNTLLQVLLLLDLLAVDGGQAGHRVACAADGRHACVVVGGALRGAAAEQLLVELLPEGSAQQVQGERVDAGVGEGQDTSDDAEQEVSQGRVHLQERLQSVTDGQEGTGPPAGVQVWGFTWE